MKQRLQTKLLQSRLFRRILIIGIVIALLWGGSNLIRREMRKVFLSPGTSEEISVIKIPNHLADRLSHWGFFGPVPKRYPEYNDFLDSIANRIRGVRGFTESDGFHGNGTDWYEVTLSSDLADEIRAKIDHMDNVKTPVILPRLAQKPDWWPDQWPENVKVYNRYNDYLFLPETGTHAWFLGIRP